MKKLSLCWAFVFFLMDWLPAAQAQTPDRTVTGQVLDGTTRQGLPGVTVLVPGTTIGTGTNTDGTFTVGGVPATATRVQFSFVGYRTVEQDITSAPISVMLTPETRALDEVVVTGLATTIKRSNLANSVATVSAQELVGQTRPVTLDAAL